MIDVRILLTRFLLNNTNHKHVDHNSNQLTLDKSSSNNKLDYNYGDDYDETNISSGVNKR